MTDAAVQIDERRPARERWKLAIVIALVSGAYALWRHARMPAFTSDLDQLWYAARALWHGQNPYLAVGPHASFQWAWPVFYPLPAILLVVPISVLPIGLARIAFSTLAGGVLGFAMGPRWRVLWPLFLSEAYFLAVSRNQWSPFVLATLWVPVLGFLVAAKPNIGIIALAAQNRRNALRVVALASSLVVLSFLVRPGWFGEWFALARTAPNKEIALLQPGGFLLLAALLLWRQSGGRLLIASALVPQTPSLYDALLFFPLCRTVRQALALAFLTHVLQWTVVALGPYSTFDAYYSSLARSSVFLILLPALVLALRNRYWDPMPGSLDPTGEARPPRSSDGTTSGTRFAPLDWALLFAVVLAQCLQLWILFRT
jgi:hypothetical protein